MTLNLRLPPELDAKAREQARERFISLNSLICQALKQYLQAPPDVPVTVAEASSVPVPLLVVPEPAKPALKPLVNAFGQKLTRGQRRAAARAQKKS